jgi:phosphohistidine phosphatase
VKKVFIVRHAKSVPYGYENDFNRDLSERGKNDAKLVSKELSNKGISADEMISSPAVRAIKTARIFAENTGFKKKNIQEMEELYQGLTSSEFLDIIKDLPDDLNTVFFFGHNPEFHFFTSYLLDHYNKEMPTCTTIGIDFNVNKWKAIEAHSGKQTLRIIPRMLK